MQSTQSDWNICGIGLPDTDASACTCRQSKGHFLHEHEGAGLPLALLTVDVLDMGHLNWPPDNNPDRALVWQHPHRAEQQPRAMEQGESEAHQLEKDSADVAVSIQVHVSRVCNSLTMTGHASTVSKGPCALAHAKGGADRDSLLDLRHDGFSLWL